MSADCPVGNLNYDCKVDWEDLRIFADQWLNPNCAGHPDDCANFDGENGVNFDDFALLAGNWSVKGPYPLVINEFMAKNDAFIRDPDDQNDFDDWIEIYNYGDQPIDIGGMYLTDDSNAPQNQWWQVPTGYPEQTTVADHGYLLIWADDETSEGPLHADFKLGAGTGEQVALFDADKSLIDSKSFGPQERG
ncbi:unnamed protein product [marine sediment metagenome]|uniref:LTD domain-containing protein n=1 Tax=marine sediment metagenome TaxID=412755 RepID=X1IKZ7_9ZZZZ